LLEDHPAAQKDMLESFFSLPEGKPALRRIVDALGGAADLAAQRKAEFDAREGVGLRPWRDQVEDFIFGMG
jgi:hypothetical protein